MFLDLVPLFIILLLAAAEDDVAPICCHHQRVAGVLWLLARQRNGWSRCAICTPHGTVTRGDNGACAGVLTWFDGDVYLGQFLKGEFHG